MIIIIGHLPQNSNGVFALVHFTLFRDGLSLIDDFGDNCDKFTARYVSMELAKNHKSLLQIYLWLMFDCGFYLGLYTYFVNIFPGEFGHSKSWYFPLEIALSYTKRFSSNKKRSSEEIPLENCNMKYIFAYFSESNEMFFQLELKANYQRRLSK